MPPQATPPADERTLTELDRARIGTLLRRTGTTEANRAVLDELLDLGLAGCAELTRLQQEALGR